MQKTKKYQVQVLIHEADCADYVLQLYASSYNRLHGTGHFYSQARSVFMLNGTELYVSAHRYYGLQWLSV